MSSFFNHFFKRPPVVMPIVALFLIIITAMDLYDWFSLISADKVNNIYALRPLVLVVYTVFWCLATFLKRWAVMGFITFSILHIAAFLFIKESPVVARILDNFMVNPLPLGILFSVILLLYFRKLK